MLLLKSIEEIRNFVEKNKLKGYRIGFVPTMGFLHEGHLELMRVARNECNIVVISIFVNPIQFGVGEDFEEYPRDLSGDLELARKVGIDAIFAPGTIEMYPEGFATFVDTGSITKKLCGSSRPGHFRGVTTVVSKLFNIVQPHIAYFGAKDAQQVLVIKKMVSDLNMPVEIKTIPTVREFDGLAKSSRNAYLDGEEREAAVVLYKSLQLAKQIIEDGERNKEAIINYMKKTIAAEPLARIDYIDILSLPDLADMNTIKGPVLIAMAVFVGSTRLIDNLTVEV